MSLDLEDLLLLGLVGVAAYTIAKRSAASPSSAATASIARMAPDPVVIAPTVVIDPYPDYSYGWGPQVWNWNFGGNRRGGYGGGHHHHGGGRRGRH